MVVELFNEARTFVDEFQNEEACLAMGLCGDDAGDDLDTYERAFVEKTNQEMCSTMGPLEAICQAVVRGDIQQVQGMDFDMVEARDLLMDCGESTGKDVCLP